ncbi:Uracil-DNA glycosylase [Lachnellula occidentalis]|uniref:Uracil-DNA glycosylase n=1 Tax=Lachnellula occidentalis TaxID=215460 RepID=A0A8H8RD13_9HELO|nr:Uracil-DNA glycosylase [Lachnellula occidentalis]
MSLKRKATNVPLSDAAKKPKANGSITSFFGGPKTVPAAKNSNSASLPAIRFNKEAWVKTLTPEQKELLKLEIDTLHDSWLKELRDDITSREFLELKKFLKTQVEAGRTVYPPMEDVYSCSNMDEN